MALAAAAVLVMPAMARAGGAGDARRLCMPDAKRLCSAQVKAMNKKAAELCLWQKIDQTSPQCHQMIVKIRAERQAKGQR